MTRILDFFHISRNSRGDLVKLTAFLVAAGLLTSYLYVITSNSREGDMVPYAAEFENVSGLESGSDVRVASVVVGRVKELDIDKHGQVLVRFDLDREIDVTSATTATVRYKNLVGDRYLDLQQGEPGGERLSPGGTIDVERTTAALDLDTLLNGFKPLFVGLAPQQINQLSEDLILVLQGQSAAVSSLLATVGSFTSTIGERDELVGQVIQNLDTTLAAVDGGDEALAGVIDQLSLLTDGLDDDATQVLDAAAQIDQLAVSASTLLAGARPDITGVLTNLQGVSQTINENRQEVDAVLTGLPPHYDTVLRTGSFGNFFNFFLCGVRLRVTPENDSTGVITTPWVNSDVDRCQT